MFPAKILFSLRVISRAFPRQKRIFETFLSRPHSSTRCTNRHSALKDHTNERKKLDQLDRSGSHPNLGQTLTLQWVMFMFNRNEPFGNNWYSSSAQLCTFLLVESEEINF